MIDFHTHILPGIDDGSASVEESVQMLRSLAQQGVDTVVATPHFSALQESPEEFLVRRAEALAQLPAEEGLPRILAGAEVAYFSNMNYCEQLRDLCVGESDLLLIEMPFTAWTDRMADDICAIPRQLGVQPVLAHVERYGRKDQFARYAEYLADTALFQCNTQHFLNGFASRKAFRQLCEGQIHFIGSDCHNMERRAPNIAQAVAAIQKKLGVEAVEALERTMRMYLFREGA